MRSLLLTKKERRIQKALRNDKEARGAGIVTTLNGYEVTLIAKEKPIHTKMFTHMSQAYTYAELWIDPFHLYSEKH